jgi:hypothetical protein
MRLREFLILVTSVVLLSCTDEISAPCATCEFTASILKLSNDPSLPNSAGSVLVRHLDGSRTTDSSVVHIGNDVPIYVLLENGRRSRGSFENVRVGQSGRFVIQNVELRSDPRQVFALEVVIVSGR